MMLASLQQEVREPSSMEWGTVAPSCAGEEKTVRITWQDRWQAICFVARNLASIEVYQRRRSADKSSISICDAAC